MVVSPSVASDRHSASPRYVQIRHRGGPRDDGTIKGSYRFHDLTPRPDTAARLRQPLQQPTSICFRHDPWIGDDDDAAIGCASDETSEALLQSQRRVRKHVLDEGIAAVSDDRLAMRGGDGLRGHPEWQLGDHERAKGIARDVDAFPEGCRPEEHRASRLAKPCEE